MEEFDILTYPKSRVATFDVGRIGGKKHHIAGFLEIDVTTARENIRSAIRNGREISFNSWMIKVIGDTVSENRRVHAINYGPGRQIAFHDVDISLPMERTVQGHRVPLATLVREVNRKTVEEIHAEIRSSAEKVISGAEDFVLTERRSRGMTGFLFSLPGFLRRLIWKVLLHSPFSIRKNMGTVIVTNIGMAGRFPGWILPKGLHNLCFGIGSIVKKPWVVKGTVAIREILHLTILFDHDVIDGAPAARFAEKLVKRIEHPEDLQDGEART